MLTTESRYKGFILHINEWNMYEGGLREDQKIYQGSAYYNGTQYYSSQSLISTESAERFLKDKIDKEENNG